MTCSMTSSASQTPRMRLAIQPLLVKLYKLAGIFALTVILVGLIAYVVVNIFYFFDHSWVRPVILSPHYDKVEHATHDLTDAESTLATFESEQAQNRAKLAHLDRTIASSQAFETDMSAAIAAAGKTLAAVSARRDLDRTVLERQAAVDDKVACELRAKTLDRQIADQHAKISELGQSYFLKARNQQVVVGFVPYENLSNARPGTTLYRCKWGLVRCSAVGKVLSILEGEVSEHHPHNDSSQRGVMVEIQLTEAAAGQESVLFAGSRPFWLF
jgi:hypothetical protein